MLALACALMACNEPLVRVQSFCAFADCSAAPYYVVPGAHAAASSGTNAPSEEVYGF